MITLAQLIEWEALAAKATPGPWFKFTHFDGQGYNNSVSAQNPPKYIGANDGTMLPGDAAFIAASRSAVPALCQAWREDQEKIARLVQEGDELQKRYFQAANDWSECMSKLREAVEVLKLVISGLDHKTDKNLRDGAEAGYPTWTLKVTSDELLAARVFLDKWGRK